MIKIKPLEWSGKNDNDFISLDAKTPFGFYEIHNEKGKLVWKYCFDEHHDEGEFEVDSVEKGKENAMDHWVKRLTSALIYEEKQAEAKTIKKLIFGMDESKPIGVRTWDDFAKTFGEEGFVDPLTLLKKYMQHVCDIEGDSFVDKVNKEMSRVEFTESEVELLNNIDKNL